MPLITRRVVEGAGPVRLRIGEDDFVDQIVRLRVERPLGVAQTRVHHDIERALYGVDGEVGYKLPVGEDTRLYLGGFHFFADNVDSITGPKARLEYR